VINITSMKLLLQMITTTGKQQLHLTERERERDKEGYISLFAYLFINVRSWKKNNFIAILLLMNVKLKYTSI